MLAPVIQFPGLSPPYFPGFCCRGGKQRQHGMFSRKLCQGSKSVLASKLKPRQ